MGKRAKDLKYYVKQIKNKNYKVEEEFKSEYQLVAHWIINKDSYGDKISSPSILAHKAFELFINRIKNGEIIKLSKVEKILENIIKNQIKDTINLQLKQLGQDLCKGNPETEKQIWDYEINTLKVIRKRNKDKKYHCINHTQISHNVIRGFISYIKKIGVTEIKNFYSVLDRIITNKMIDETRKYRRYIEKEFPIELCSESTLNNVNLFPNKFNPWVMANLIEVQNILYEIIQELNPFEQELINKRFYEGKIYEQIVKDFLEVRIKTTKSSICRKIQKIIKKMETALNKKNIYKINDLIDIDALRIEIEIEEIKRENISVGEYN